MQPVRAVRTPLALAAAVLGVLLALLAAPPASALQPDPGHDYYEIPQGCAGPARPDAQAPHGCRLTAWRNNRPTVVLWGDSHAWQQIPALLRASNAENVNLTAFVMGKCPPSKIRIQSRYPGKCEQSNALALKYVRETAARSRQPVQVILGSHWAGFRQAIRIVETTGQPPEGYDEFDLRMLKLFRDHTPKLFPALLRTKARLAMIGQTATCQNGVKPPLRCTQSRSDAIQNEGATRAWLAGLSHHAPQIDVNQGLCSATRCRGKIAGVYTWWDWGHLSKTADVRLAPYFRPLLHGLRN